MTASPRQQTYLKQPSFLRGPTTLVLAASAACAPPVAGQVATLPSVEIVGTTPLPGIGLPKEQVPANVQSARGEDIDRSHASDLPTFMNRRLGSVYVNEIQNNPFQPDVSFRGFTASPLLGTPQGLSVYLDGVRMNQPFGDVVSWDLIPRVAISSLTLMPGSNPLFGLNTLGGAISLVTKDGVANPGSSVQVRGGTHGLAEVEFESGGSQPSGVDWYAAGDRFHSRGWREASPSDVGQLFGKLGWRDGDTGVSLSASVADNDLTGNGLQEQRLLARDRASIYTSPDTTRNRSLTLNLEGTHRLSDSLSFSGNAYYRNIRTATLNGDANDDALDQQVYQPDAAEQRALADAGYTGVPTSGANAANTPFPQWRCIANALLNDAPAENCSGVVNSTETKQQNYGFAGQLSWQESVAGHANVFVAGAAFDASRVRFTQGSQLGYINPDHTITGVGAFGDGGVTGGSVDGVPYDTRVDLNGQTRTWSVFATDTVALGSSTHLTVSGRYNHMTVKNRDAILPGGGPGSLDSDSTFARLNPAVGITFTPAPALNFYAGYNEGSRAPSAIELGCADPGNPCKLPNAFAGDPPLRQVVTKTVELGVRGGSKSSLAWNAGVFRADSSDDILFVADNPSGFGYFKNFGKTRRQGIEAGLNASAGSLAMGANYTYLDATYRSTEIVGAAGNSSNDQALAGLPGIGGTIQISPGNRMPLVPRQMLKVFASYDIDAAWSLGLDMVAFAGSIARGNENNQHQSDGLYYLGAGHSAGYAVVNLTVDYRPTPKLKFFALVSNLLDRRYNTAAQLGATAFDAKGDVLAQPFRVNAAGDRPLQYSTFYAQGAPRAFVLGVRYAFGD